MKVNDIVYIETKVGFLKDTIEYIDNKSVKLKKSNIFTSISEVSLTKKEAHFKFLQREYQELQKNIQEAEENLKRKKLELQKFKESHSIDKIPELMI